MNLNSFVRNRGTSLQSAINSVTKWEPIFQGTEIGIVHAIVYSKDLKKFVMQTGEFENIYTSSDGINWEDHNVASLTEDLRRIIWVSELGIFIGITSDNVTNDIFISKDGLSWESNSSGINGNLADIDWSPSLGLMVTVSFNTTGDEYVATSPDGVTWTKIEISGGSQDWSSVVWSTELGMFVVVGMDSGTAGKVAFSYDGVNWERGPSSNENANWVSVEWSPELGLFISTAASGTGDRLMYSRLPTSSGGWESISIPEKEWFEIIWCSELGVFLVIGDNETILASTNGVDWDEVVVPESYWGPIDWSPDFGLFVLGSYIGTDTVMVSRRKIEYTPEIHTSTEDPIASDGLDGDLWFVYDEYEYGG